MKLHLLIDSKLKTEFSINDVVIISQYNKVNIKGCNRLYVASKSNIECSEGIYNEMTSAFKNMDVLLSKVANPIYTRFLSVIYMYFDLIDNIVKEYCIDEIVLYEGCKHVYCISTHAEGEGIRRDYQTNWLVNSLIYNRYSNEIEISWIKKSTMAVMYIKNYINYINEILHLILSCVVQYVCRRKEIKNEVLYKQGVTNVVSIIDLPLQYRFLERIIKKNTNINWIRLTTTLLLKDTDKQCKYVGGISLIKLSKIMFRISRIEKIKFETPTIVLDNNSFRREVKYLALLYSVRLERIKNFCIDNGIDSRFRLVTNTAVSIDMLSARGVAKVMGMDHYNYQCVTMGRTLYPDLKLADYYYLYSGKTYELYKHKASCYRRYFPLFDNTPKTTTGNKIVFSIFMQPDQYMQDYLNYMHCLFEILKNRTNVKVIVKPHYRQNRMEEIHELAERYAFVDIASKNDDCSTIIKKSDLCMSVHSSVLFETMAYRTPSIIYNPDHMYDFIVHNNDICFPEVNFEITQPIDTLYYIDNIKNIYIEYNKRFEMYIKYIKPDAGFNNVPS